MRVVLAVSKISWLGWPTQVTSTSTPPTSSSTFLAILRTALQSSRSHSYAAIVGPESRDSRCLCSGPISSTRQYRDLNFAVISLSDRRSLSTQITEHPPSANSSARDSPRVEEAPAICGTMAVREMSLASHYSQNLISMMIHDHNKNGF